MSKNAALVLLSLPLVSLLPGCPSNPSGDDSSTSDDEIGEVGSESPTEDDGPVIICEPGETRCLDAETLETCAPTGLEWEAMPCPVNDSCMACSDEDPDCTGARCVGPCDLGEELPSSAGCSFLTTGMMIGANAGGGNMALPDALVIANPNEAGDATVSINVVPEGSNQEDVAVEPFVLAPGEIFTYEYEEDFTDYENNGQGTSKYQSGGIYHVVSDLPVIAYLHSPLEASGINESSLLLPETALRQDYVIYNHTPYIEPGYFVVVAVEDQTTVRWTPPVETAGNNLPLPFVNGGETGEYTINRFDTMRIAASANLMRPECEQDLSGTVVEADKPILVISAVVGARVPYCATVINESTMACAPDPYPVDPNCQNTTDYLQEVNIPLDYWGKTYVGAHSPLRGSEDHYWRVFAAAEDTTITVDPPQPGTPINLANRGDWADLVIPSGVNVIFTSDKPFMPVQYMSRHDLADDQGDPAMTQSIPVEQFLSRYAFVTGVNYGTHYVQVIREAGSADVLLDGAAVGGYETVGDYEVVDIEISEGPHEVRSDDPFGIVQWGWNSGSAPAAYAYPGGLKVEEIFIP